MRSGATRSLLALAVVLLGGLASAESPPVVAEPVALSGGGRWPVELGAALDSIGFLPGAPHLLFALGTEFPYDDRGRFRLVQAVQLEYRAQPQFLHGPGVSTRLLARFVADNGLFAEVGGGGGLLVGWYGVPTWTFNPQTGSYEEGGNRARFIFKVSLGVAVGMDLSVRWKVPLRLTLGYDEVLLFNVAPEAGFPVVPSAVVGLRVAWFLGSTR